VGFSTGQNEGGFFTSDNGVTLNPITLSGATVTGVNAINDAGQIVGSYMTGSGIFGFMTPDLGLPSPPLLFREHFKLSRWATIT